MKRIIMLFALLATTLCWARTNEDSVTHNDGSLIRPNNDTEWEYKYPLEIGVGSGRVQTSMNFNSQPLSRELSKEVYRFQTVGVSAMGVSIMFNTNFNKIDYTAENPTQIQWIQAKFSLGKFYCKTKFGDCSIGISPCVSFLNVKRYNEAYSAGNLMLFESDKRRKDVGLVFEVHNSYYGFDLTLSERVVAITMAVGLDFRFTKNRSKILSKKNSPKANKTHYYAFDDEDFLQ